MWSLLITIFVAGVVAPIAGIIVLSFFGKLGWPLLGVIAAVCVGLGIINDRIKKL